MKTENVIQTKSYTFAVRIVRLYQHLSAEKREYVLSKQVLRCGTSIGLTQLQQFESRNEAGGRIEAE